MQIYTDAAQAALRQAKRISGQMKHPYTGTEHILLGLLREQESTAGQVLINAGVTEAGTYRYEQSADRAGRRDASRGRQKLYSEGQKDSG